jgi:biopolymer transport protein ExbD
MRIAKLLLLMLAALLPLTGCLGSRDPVPSHAVVITADVATYRFDGQPMAIDQLQRELAAVAKSTRRSDGTVRLLLRIASDPGADYQRTIDLVDWCAGQGLTNIELTTR